MILGKTATFEATADEIKGIVAHTGDTSYFLDKGVVLGGVRYRLVRTFAYRLVAEDGKNGVVFRQASRGKWAIGIYDETLAREDAEWEIQDAASYLN